ncbi:TetR/AcrR family transcriptional regulator [Burkholderia multivorans]|uniref:TetR/AcrR family transcriptional regulator n=1 Tax=Burkholderia multivorans TaxID=87883 RepID=UPI0021C10B36|nr:TetR/AcrR family transcriptional regulator [Burkholderia multivorans]
MTQRPRQLGRPRTFDHEAALRQAVRLFWRQGYDGTSISDLTRATGASPPTLYAAFGSKEGLYRDALRYYSEHEGCGNTAAFKRGKSALESITLFLRNAAVEFTAADRPAGCMVSTGELQCSTAHADTARMAATMRAVTIEIFRKRFEQAVRDGELPARTDSSALARFYGAVVQGMSAQAIDGASVEELNALADCALSAWPQR